MGINIFLQLMGFRTPQNMATWQIKYFKLKESEKCEKQEGHPDPPLPLSPEAGHKTLRGEIP